MTPRNRSTDPEDWRMDVALYRVSCIAPVLYGTLPAPAAEHFRRIARDEHDVPHLGRKRYAASTFKSWLNSYRAGGIEALKPKPRCDAGTSRAIDQEMHERIAQILVEHPRVSAERLRSLLIDEGLITSPSPSASTIRRHIRWHGLRVQGAPPRGRHSFAKQQPNELWILDFMHGPKIGAITSKLVAMIDDASRYIVLGRILASETYEDLAPCLLETIQRHGVPKAIYCDNGSAFSTRDLALACARLKIALIHSRPYDSESRGKIERFFRTVRGRFLAAAKPDTLGSFADLHDAFTTWLEADYHRRRHSGIGDTPLNRFLESMPDRQWVSRQELDLVFYRTIHRKVRKDCTVSIKGTRYEVSPEYIGKKVELRSPLDEPETYYLFADGKPVLTLKPLDLVDNDRRNTRARFADLKDEGVDNSGKKTERGAS